MASRTTLIHTLAALQGYTQSDERKDEQATASSRISVDANICFGRPCIRGHRIWASLVLDLLAGGWTMQELIEQYPGIEEEDVLACLAYGAENVPRTLR